MNATDQVSNQISGGVFLNTVVMGRDIQLMLPPEIRPAVTGLPPAAPVFTGRDTTVQALLDRLDPARHGGTQVVSAVAGMAGVGKTELVVHAAHQAIQRGWFPGGVLFVDMLGYDADRRLSARDALAGWLTALGIGEHIPATEQDRSRLWRSALHAYITQHRRLLLIIDNVAGEDQVRPLLPADDRLPVLVTSRHTLDIDARLHDLHILDPDAAATLIGKVIAERRGPDDPRLAARAHLGELADLCAGLPLALRIVAALLADRPHLQPAVLAHRLRDEQGRLNRLTRDHAAVRATFDLSYQHLTADQARLFRLLPINPGPDIATAAAAHLAGLAYDETTVLLEDLHRAHLVSETEPDRWRMHDLVRLYAAERLPAGADETEAGRCRLFGFYVSTAHSANSHMYPTDPADISVFADRDHALVWLDAERANLLAASTTAPAHGLPDTSLALADKLDDFLTLRRHFTDIITINTLARDLCRQAGNHRGEALASTRLGIALRQARRFDEAIDVHTHALELHLQTGDANDHAKTFTNLGTALRDARRFDEAISMHRRVLDHFQQTGDRHREAVAWGNLGVALSGVRRFDEAIDAHSHALTFSQQTGDQSGQARAWGNLGVALFDVRRFDEAIDAHIHARDAYQQTGDQHGEAVAWGNLGMALHAMRRFDEAIDAHTRALDAFQQIGDQHSEGLAWGNLGGALTGARRLDEAIDAALRARHLLQQSGDRHSEGMAWNQLGAALTAMHRFEEAIDAQTQAIHAFQQTGDQHSEARAWIGLGFALTVMDRADEADNAHTQAIHVFQRQGDRHSEGLAWIGLGGALWAGDRFDAAIDANTHAIAALQWTGDQYNAGLAWCQLGFALAEVRRFEEAVDAHAHAVGLLRHSGDLQNEGTNLVGLSFALEAVHRIDEARVSAQRALDAFVEAGDADAVADIREWLDEVGSS